MGFFHGQGAGGFNLSIKFRICKCFHQIFFINSQSNGESTPACGEVHNSPFAFNIMEKQEFVG